MEEKLKKDLLLHIKNYIAVRQDIENFINRHERYADLLEYEIIEIMDKLGITSFDKIKLEERELPISVSVEDIKREFLDENMVNYVVVKIDQEQTIRNLKLKNGLSDQVVMGYIDRLREFFIESKPTLVIKR